MAEYATLKVPELKKLLAEKKLPQTGNKADLIARLQEDDRKKAGGTAAATSKPPAGKEDKEDEITYSDDDEAAAPSAAPAPKPAPKPASKPDEDKKKPAPAAAEPAEQEPSEPAEKSEESKVEGETAPAATAVTFALGLSATAAEIEAKKRADRAKRFGIEEDDEARKRAERAKRFGIDEKGLASGLDSALSERPLKRTRAHDKDEGNRPVKRQSLDRDGRNRRNERAPRPAGSNGPANKSSILDDPVERAKAEKRAARFAAV